MLTGFHLYSQDTAVLRLSPVFFRLSHGQALADWSYVTRPDRS
jgi:hypothetical protein